MSLLKRLLEKFSPPGDQQRYTHEVLYDEVHFRVDSKLVSQIADLSASEWLLQQHIALQMLVEQELAEAIPNGFIVAAEVIGSLDVDTRALLQLPPVWDGSFTAHIKGVVTQSNFEVELQASRKGMQATPIWKLTGPFLRFSEATCFTLSSAEVAALSALARHRESQHTEFDNLTLIYIFQEAKRSGCRLTLQHFDNLAIHSPQKVGLTIEERPDGSLILQPQFGQQSSPMAVSARLGQLGGETTALRVQDEIILLDDRTMAAAKEIMSNREIPKSQVTQFLAQPSAYIDASMVDLDSGFSFRVHGARKFRHAYFGETDESGINWIGERQADYVPINTLIDWVEDEEDLSNLQTLCRDAIETGAQEITFKRKCFDVSDREQLTTVLEKAAKKISEQIGGDGNGGDSEWKGVGIQSGISSDVAVVNIDLNDEQLDIESPSLKAALSEVLYPDELDYSSFKRLPYPHQDFGIKWLLGITQYQTDGKSVTGALLADDMGLGKTYMSLGAVYHYYEQQRQAKKIQKPVLVVAPLSLLDNWKDEVEATFTHAPFDDIVILQSDAELNRFRHPGASAETKIQKLCEDEAIDESQIRYALKLGKHYGTDRLDMPQRLVITTYQTLRDYQFSLCRIDWAIVIFDEAQNIKNPNALQTRAAKGLKADFKLLVTGTPVENHLGDFWCLMDTAMPGYLGSYQEFREQYVIPILRAPSDELAETRAYYGRLLRTNVGALMLRRLKEDHLDGLPPKKMWVGLDDHEWRYLSLLHTTLAGEQKEMYDGVIAAANQSEHNAVLDALRRLRDVSLHPRLVDHGHLSVPANDAELKKILRESAKLSSVLAVLDEIRGRQEKAIIFCVNKRLQSFLSIVLGRLYRLGALSIINGDAKAVSGRGSKSTRKEMIAEFETSSGFNIIIMSPVAAGVGLTVVGANNVIHLERHWNPAKEAQATDRVYRIGQKKEVNIYIPILHHPEFESFDVNLHRLLGQKMLLKDAVVTPEDVVPSPGGFGQFLASDMVRSDMLKTIPWGHFEALAAELAGRHLQASSVYLTPKSNDYGADVVVDLGDSLVLIQCKHSRQVNFDGQRAIREVFSAKPHYENCIGKPVSALWLMTNAQTVSTASRKEANHYQVEILTLDRLLCMLDDFEIHYDELISRLNKRRLNVTD